MRQTMRRIRECGICGCVIDAHHAAQTRVTIELFGVNWDGWINEGKCPAPWCLSYRAVYSPEQVLANWLRHLKEVES